MAKLPDDDVRAAFVFGSVAWGDADEASDIDLMLCLDRPADYREVTRVRVADLLGRTDPGTLTSPVFADIDRISAERFAKAVTDGVWHARVAHSLVLTDTDGWFADLRAQVSATFHAPESGARRAQPWYDASLAHLDAARHALADDLTLATLRARLALENAAVGLLEACGLRNSTTHFLDSARRALELTEQTDLYQPLLRGLGVDVDLATAARGVETFHVLAEALRGWMADPEVAGQLRPEDVAWAAFTYADETYEEVAHKVAAMRGAGRSAALAAYVDGLLKTPLRMNLGKVLNLRLTGSSQILSITEFHLALRRETELFEHWCRGLRLPANRAEIAAALELATHLRDCIPSASNSL
nr:nucleotidyltransferase domain-containing protein [Actinopolymorpha pittospori]